MDEDGFLSWCVDESTYIKPGNKPLFYGFKYPYCEFLHPQKVTKNKHFWFECDENNTIFFCYSGISSMTVERTKNLIFMKGGNCYENIIECSYYQWS